uniref:Mannosyltransferase n=1 Tax=Aegilops tauschii TaxID=37682 RepID=N1QRJ2_AEGTA
MAPPPPAPTPAARLLREYGWDLMLGSIAAFYAVMVPYTKVEESFNVQAMHDILYHNHHIEKYDHLEFPGVVPRTFIGALVIAILSSPAVLIIRVFHVPKIYSLLAVRLVLGCVILTTLRLFRVEVKRKFGRHVEAFFVVLTAIQFHVLFYSTRPLPNILALALVNLAYSFWFKGNYLRTLQALIVAAVVFRCDMILLLGTIGAALLLEDLCNIQMTVVIREGPTSVLHNYYIIQTHSIHWYFTSALPRSMLVAYPLCLELRFIIAAVPMLNVSASLAANRLYNNRKKSGWNFLYVLMLGAFLASLGYSAVSFMASYSNYPGGHALKALHEAVSIQLCVPLLPDSSMKEKVLHIDVLTAMSGVSRFCENEYPWRYSKEEDISIEEYQNRNFTYLLNEHRYVSGYKCLFGVDGFSRARIQPRFPPLSLVKVPKVFAHGNTGDPGVLSLDWPGCP